MASESVTILIDAENKASAELKKVGNDLEGMSKRVKDVGQKTKASVEIAGTLANAFGGSAFGAFASQMAQVTERVSAFSEVAKAGTAGAMAFKLGLVAAAGAVTYKVAETVAAWWFEIDKAKEKAAQAEKAFTAMSAALTKVQAKAFAETKEDLSLIRDPAERERATNEAAARIERQSKELDNNIAKATAEVERRQREFNNQWTGDDTNLKIAQDQLENLKGMKAGLDAEAESLRALTSERAKSIEARKAENAAQDKSDAFLQGLREEITLLKATKEERLAIEAAKNVTPEQRSTAQALLAEREVLKAKAEEMKKAELEADLARKKEEDGLRRIAELEKKRLIDLEARRIELEQGREAAAAYRLEQEGLSKATAEKLAAAEEQVRRSEAAASTRVPSAPVAFESRVMSRGISQDPQLVELRKLQEAQRKTAEETAKNGKTLRDIYEESKRRGKVLELEVIQ